MKIFVRLAKMHTQKQERPTDGTSHQSVQTRQNDSGPTSKPKSRHYWNTNPN